MKIEQSLNIERLGHVSIAMPSPLGHVPLLSSYDILNDHRFPIYYHKPEPDVPATIALCFASQLRCTSTPEFALVLAGFLYRNMVKLLFWSRDWISYQAEEIRAISRA